MTFPIIIDAHLDLAYNALDYGRDYRNAAHTTRRLEADAEHVKHSGECTVGFPDMLRGRVGLAFATIFVEPASRGISGNRRGYADAQEAHALGMTQLDWYHRLADSEPHIALVTDQRSLRDVLSDWRLTPDGAALASDPKRKDRAPLHRIGLIPLMEGADPIREPKELERWYERGVRIIGPAWDTTRYAGGTWQMGRITKLGFELLEMMAQFNVALDVSHLSHESLYEALDAFEGKHIIATHCNAARYVPNVAGRHLPDDAIERLAERNGVIGVVPFNRFLKKDWSGRKHEVTLDDVVRHIDHICQLTGSADHVGIGSDFDGGLGYQDIPAEMDTVRDHYKIGVELSQRGYSQAQVEQVMFGNWLRLLRAMLP
jgi:membrane dipeptidase